MDNTGMGGRNPEAGESSRQPTSFLPRNISSTIMFAFVILATIAAFEPYLLRGQPGTYDYSRWPDDYLAACGELSRARAILANSPWTVAMAIMAGGMLILVLCENFWDRLRIARQSAMTAGVSRYNNDTLLDGIGEQFRSRMFILMSAIFLVEALGQLLALPFFADIQVLALTRYVALPVWFLLSWLPAELRAELQSFDTIDH